MCIFSVDLWMFPHAEKFICLIMYNLATKIETNQQKAVLNNLIKHSYILTSLKRLTTFKITKKANRFRSL